MDSRVERMIEQRLDDPACERLDEVILFVRWLLERYPDSDQSQALPDGEHWLIRSAPLPLVGAPSVRLVYSFTDAEVFWYGIAIDCTQADDGGQAVPLVPA